MAISSSKDHPESSPAGQRAKADAVKADTSTADVQKQVDEDQARGFRGVEVDPTDNSAYTVQGVTSGAPTPETDEEQAARVREHLRSVERDANGVAKR